MVQTFRRTSRAQIQARSEVIPFYLAIGKHEPRSGVASGVTVPLSILDLAPIAPGETVRDSFAASVALAQQAEASGYRRVWYAEHHNMATIASSATAVLIAHVASQTSTIRLGAGGVMLPNHAPLTIAEQFGTLESLHPGRIDLGLGRAPGSDQATFRALRRDPASSEHFPDDVLELQAFLAGQSRVPGVNATPGAGTRVPLYILGSSLFGARLAAALGLPYAFASHFAPDALHQAVAIYRREFTPSEQLERPHVIAGVNAIATDDRDDAAAQLARVKRARLVMLLRQSGRIPLDREFGDDELDYLLTTPAGAQVQSMATYTGLGTGADVSDYIEDFARAADVDEVIVAHASLETAARLRSVELLADAHARVAA
jgi:luciferase family oxidoreductase group 1